MKKVLLTLALAGALAVATTPAGASVIQARAARAALHAAPISAEARSTLDGIPTRLVDGVGKLHCRAVGASATMTEIKRLGRIANSNLDSIDTVNEGMFLATALLIGYCPRTLDAILGRGMTS